METTKEILDRIDQGDGAELTLYECKKHGEFPHLVISNQGGYDATYCCLQCATDLLTSITPSS